MQKLEPCRLTTHNISYIWNRIIADKMILLDDDDDGDDDGMVEVRTTSDKKGHVK